MPLVSFSSMDFKAKIEAHEKRTTIRPRGKRCYRLGSTLMMWYKSRRPEREYWGAATLLGMANLEIHPEEVIRTEYLISDDLIMGGSHKQNEIAWEDRWLWENAREVRHILPQCSLSWIEGFQRSADFWAWFDPILRKQNPYQARLLYWGGTFQQEDELKGGGSHEEKAAT